MARCIDKRMDGYYTRHCSRDAKPGEVLCGIHLAGKKRQEANDAKRREANAAMAERQQQERDICDQLRELGVDAFRTVDFSGTSVISLDAATALALVERLKAERGA